MKTRTNLTITHEKISGSHAVRVNVYTPKEMESITTNNIILEKIKSIIGVKIVHKLNLSAFKGLLN